VDRGKDIVITVRSQDANSKTLLAHAIQNVNWSPLYAMQGCDEMATCFYDTITGIIDHYLPCVAMKRHTNDKPWVTDKFRRLIRCRQHAMVSGEKTKYRMLRNRVQRMSRQLRRKYYDRKVRDLRENNSRSWWRSVKQITGMESKSTVPLRGLADELYDGNMEALANGINEFFQQVAADLHPLLDSFTPPPADHFPSEFFIVRETVELKLSRVKISKAPGPDGVPNWILRDFCTELSGPVCAMFNASIREGRVPQRWKEANVLPVPKTHPPRSIETDLRPISLTSTLVKLLESIVGAWMLERIENKLDVYQYGALKGRSTTHALVDMLHHWSKAIDEGQSVRAVFIDFAKAFDHVDHNVMINKLLAFGMPDTIIRWMCSFLTCRRQRVKIGEVVSEWLEMAAGMPQGSFLGPLTFIILTDDLRANCLTHKFIDDTTLTEIIKKNHTTYMQSFVDDLAQQAAQHNMNVNTKKTKEMLIGPIAKNPPQQLTLSGTTVDRVDTFKLLGVHVSADLKWTQHVNAISAKAASRIYFLKQLKRTGAQMSDLMHFYTAIVRPVLEYASPVWHSSLTVAQTETLESLQKRALRIMYDDGDYELLLILAQIDSLETRRDQLTSRFFKRQVLDNKSVLHYLLPPKRNLDVIDKLRHAKPYELAKMRTDRFKKSLIPYCLASYQ